MTFTERMDAPSRHRPLGQTLPVVGSNVAARWPSPLSLRRSLSPARPWDLPLARAVTRMWIPVLARPSALLGSSSRPSPDSRLHPLCPSRHPRRQRTPAVRFDFVCGHSSLPNSCRRPRSRSPSTHPHAHAVASVCRKGFTTSRSQPVMCHAPLMWFLTTSADWGLRHPRASCSPISDTRFAAFRSYRLVKPPGPPAPRHPCHAVSRPTGTRWDTDGTPRCVPHPSKTFSSPTAAAPHDAACPRAVHRPSGPSGLGCCPSITRDALATPRLHPAGHPVRLVDIAA